MLLARVLFIGAVLVLVQSGVATAQKVNSTVDLSSSGNTIGGPGGVANSTGGQAVFFQSTSDQKVCVTISNFGAPVTFQIDGVAGLVVQPLATVTTCADNVNSVGGTCEGGTACKYIWRVDGKAP